MVKDKTPRFGRIRAFSYGLGRPVMVKWTKSFIKKVLQMVNALARGIDEKWIVIASILVAFFASSFLLRVTRNILPRDGGRDFAFNGRQSAGKPRGAGIVIISVFAAVSLLFIPVKSELIIYYVLIFAAMLSGFFDDRASKPWGEYVKGLIDLIISVMTALTYVNFNGTRITVLFTGSTLVVSEPVFIILATILIWISINVTNCSDGIDGFSGTLSVVTMASAALILTLKSGDVFMYKAVIVMIFSILAYLWVNAEPSALIMGDAGSRAIGVFMAICVLKTGSPLLYFPLAFILIFDGLPGLIKIFLLRFLKIKVLTKTRTPIHDHVRKNLHWSNTQTIFRFTIIQLMISALTVISVCFVS
jgi:phospho-N-acetylmuramoyl-pentapeptide-transferase